MYNINNDLLYKGVKGVGPVLAKVLLNHFDTVHAIFDMRETRPDDFVRELDVCLFTAKEEGRGTFTTKRVLKLLSEVTVQEIELYRSLLSLRKDIDHLIPACPRRLSLEGPQTLSDLHSAHFRYLGERRSAEEELQSIAPDLSIALKKLRRVYHHLDRIP